MKRHKVKFNEDGEVCPTDPRILKLNPMCANYIQYDKIPFNPVNPHPDLPLRKLGKIPEKLDIPAGDPNKFNKLKKIGDSGYNYQTLPQDYTNQRIPLHGRKILETSAESQFQKIPTLNQYDMDFIDIYEPPRNVTFDRVNPNPNPYKQEIRNIGEIELQEFPSVLRSSRLPQLLTDEDLIEYQERQLKAEIELQEFPSVLRSERLPPLLTDEDLIEYQERQLKGEIELQDLTEPPPSPPSQDTEQEILNEALNKITEGREQLTLKEFNSVVKTLRGRGIELDEIYWTLTSADLVDLELEQQIEGLPKKEISNIRNIKNALEKFTARQREQLDMPLVRRQITPSQADIELQEITPLTERTAIESRSFPARMIQKRATRLKLPAEVGKKLAEITDVFKGKLTEQPRQYETDIEFQPEFRDVQISRPTLKFTERIGEISSFNRSLASGTAELGIGLGLGIGASKALDQMGLHNVYLNGGLSGVAAGGGTKMITLGAASALKKAGVLTGEQIALKEGLTSIGKMGAVGGVLSLVSIPVDLGVNELLEHYSNLNHASIGAISGTAGAVVGVGVGTAAASIMVGSAALSFETFGLSLLFGAIAAAVSAGIGAAAGAQQDKAERENEEAKTKLLTKISNRSAFVNSLEAYDYNFDKALANFTKNEKSKTNLGVDDDDWGDFSNQVKNLFNAKDITQSPDISHPTDEKEKKLSNLFNKYIQNRIADSNLGDAELLKKYPPLTGDEIIYLNKNTGSTWEDAADLQLNLTFTHQKMIRDKVTKAQKEIYRQWSEENTIVSKSSQLYKDASLDSNFESVYLLNLQRDAQQQISDAFYNDQTRVEQMPLAIVLMAYKDPQFEQSIHEFYKSMDNTANRMGVTTKQLIDIQTAPEANRESVFKQISLENMGKSQSDVETAQKIIDNQNKARQEGAYDIDAYLLETDPTLLGVWRPTDSQLLQAHSAGMTLEEYLQFMSELSQGKTDKLPEYSQEHIRLTGDIDFQHFQDELELGGYGRDMYNYNRETLEFTLNPNYNELPINTNVEKFISAYAPRKLQEQRQEYLHHIIGMNQEKQQYVDNYNADLQKQLSIYGNNYDRIVAVVNDDRMYAGRSDLLHVDTGAIYQQQKLEFKPSTNKFGIGEIQSHTEAVKSTLNKEAADRFGVDIEEYHQIKQKAGEILKKTNQPITQTNVEQIKQEIEQKQDSS
jgi:hypothetical protein